jgi:hypothetical protein
VFRYKSSFEGVKIIVLENRGSIYSEIRDYSLEVTIKDDVKGYIMGAFMRLGVSKPLGPLPSTTL